MDRPRPKYGRYTRAIFGPALHQLPTGTAT
jgi:hypothetical protein